MTFDDAATVLTEDDCLALLRSRELGRIAFDVEDRVEIFPVNYGIEGKIIVFRTSPGTKLAANTFAGCPCIPPHLGTGGIGSGSSRRRSRDGASMCRRRDRGGPSAFGPP